MSLFKDSSLLAGMLHLTEAGSRGCSAGDCPYCPWGTLSPTNTSVRLQGYNTPGQMLARREGCTPILTTAKGWHQPSVPTRKVQLRKKVHLFIHFLQKALK